MLALIVVLALSFYYVPLTPMSPYKMQWDNEVYQNVRINELNRPQTYLIVSQFQGYSLTFGSGYHMLLGDFLKNYNSSAAPLTKKGENKPDTNIPPDVYVFREKNIFEVSKANGIYKMLEPDYIQRKIQYTELEQWLADYSSHHYKYDIFYDDQNLQIIHIHRNDSTDIKNTQIWGNTATQ